MGGEETSYLISEDGELYNLKTGRFRKWNRSPDGYFKCTIEFRKHYFKVSAHRLVALGFIPNPENKPEVNHKDGDKSHNYISNLEWVTSSENTQHAIELGLKWYYGMKGMNNANNSYTDNQIHRACKMMENPMNRPLIISNITGVSRHTLYKISKHKMWTHISSSYNMAPERKNLKSERIKSLYEAGYSSKEIAELIMPEFELPDKLIALQQVRDITKRYVEELVGSTTIDQLQ